jgi:hypothetical protein
VQSDKVIIRQVVNGVNPAKDAEAFMQVEQESTMASIKKNAITANRIMSVFC